MRGLPKCVAFSREEHAVGYAKPVRQRNGCKRGAKHPAVKLQERRGQSLRGGGATQHGLCQQRQACMAVQRPSKRNVGAGAADPSMKTFRAKVHDPSGWAAAHQRQPTNQPTKTRHTVPELHALVARRQTGLVIGRLHSLPSRPLDPATIARPASSPTTHTHQGHHHRHRQPYTRAAIYARTQCTCVQIKTGSNKSKTRTLARC